MFGSVFRSGACFDAHVRDPFHGSRGSVGILHSAWALDVLDTVREDHWKDTSQVVLGQRWTSHEWRVLFSRQRVRSVTLWFAGCIVDGQRFLFFFFLLGSAIASARKTTNEPPRRAKRRLAQRRRRPIPKSTSVVDFLKLPLQCAFGRHAFRSQVLAQTSVGCSFGLGRCLQFAETAQGEPPKARSNRKRGRSTNRSRLGHVKVSHTGHNSERERERGADG